MGSSIEGFLFAFGASRQRSIYCLPIYCVLTGRRFAQFRHKGDLVPLRSGLLDHDHRVEDTGRQLINGKILYTIRLYHISDFAKEVLLGAVSPEETAEWIKAFTSALRQPLPNNEDVWSPAASIKHSYSSENLAGENESPRLALAADLDPDKVSRQRSLTSLTIGNETPHLSSPFVDPPGVDSPKSGSLTKWRLIRCENGLRYFEEIPDINKVKMPVMKSVGVVKASAEHIFNVIMSYGSERSQWDHTFQSASVLESIDGHSDIIHVCLRQDWMWLRPRDLCISRYWMRDEIGAYSVFYRSSSKYPVHACHIRVVISSGGYVVTPLKSSASGKPRSLVESILEMDVAGCSSWMGFGLSQYPTYLRDSLLSTVAGIREYFTAQRVDSTATVVKRHIVEFPDHPSSLLSIPANSNTPFLSSEDADEFFDATMDQLSDTSEGYADTMDLVTSTSTSKSNWEQVLHLPSDSFKVDWSKFIGCVPKGPLVSGKHCYSQPDSSGFKIRSQSYLCDGSLVPAGDPLFRLVAVDWFKAKERIYHIAKRKQSVIQKRSVSKELFFFIVNLQVPQTEHYSLVFYFATERTIVEGSLLDKFIKSDDTFRNSRLTLVPAVAEGSWIIKQAVGSRAVSMAQILEICYHSGSNYIEVDVNLGSSGIVRGVLSLVFGYIAALVVDMAFLLQGHTEEELPENLLGVVRLSHLQLEKATPLP